MRFYRCCEVSAVCVCQCDDGPETVSTRIMKVRESGEDLRTGKEGRKTERSGDGVI